LCIIPNVAEADTLLFTRGARPPGTGKGGKSIYATPNGKFPDELVETLKHSKRGVVSIASSGPHQRQPVLHHVQGARAPQRCGQRVTCGVSDKLIGCSMMCKSAMHCRLHADIDPLHVCTDGLHGNLNALQGV
jgi:hypothetical protein